MNTAWKRNRLALTAALTILGAAFTCAAGWKEGDQVPSLAKYGVGAAVTSNLAGRVTLVDFWASWCSPCQASFPALAKLEQTFGPRGFAVIAVSVDETETAMKQFLADHSVPFLVIWDRTHKIVADANVDSMPSSFLIDRAGRIRYVHVGFHGEATAKKYAEEIETLLGRKDNAAP